jgi:hypothetical protein
MKHPPASIARCFLVPAFLVPAATGCIPMGYALEAAGALQATSGDRGAGAAGGGVGARVHANGSRGLTLAVDGAALGALTGSPCCAWWRGEGGAGYAFVPRPFEASLGYEALVLGGVESLAESSGSRVELLAGGRLALLWRITANDSVWQQDRSPSAPVWFLVPLVTLGPALPLSGDKSVAFDAFGGIALRAGFYDRNAP